LVKSLITKIRSLPKGVKASLGYFFASVITSGIAYITTPIYTRLLPSDVFGHVSVFLTWQQILGIIAMFSLQAGVFNNGMLQYSDDRDGYTYSMLLLSNTITIAFGVLFAILYPYISSLIRIEPILLCLMMTVFLTQPAYNFWTSRQRYEYKYKKTVIVTIMSALISPIFAIICIANGKNKLYSRLFGAEIPLILIYMVFYIYVIVKGRGRLRVSYWKEALLFNLPLIPHYLSAYLLGSSDKIMISILVGDTQTAYYSVAHTIAMVVTIVWSAANASLVPFTYEKCKTEDYKSISRTTLPILSFFAVACIGIILLAPELLHFMASSEYQQGLYVIPPIIGGVFFQVQYYMYANVLYYKKKTLYVMIASVSSAILNILLNYIFIPKYGFIAAGYTTIASYFMQACIDYFAMKKVMKNSIYNMKYVAFLSFAVVAIALISNISYGYPFVRFIVLFILLIIAILMRNRIIAIFRFKTN